MYIRVEYIRILFIRRHFNVAYECCSISFPSSFTPTRSPFRSSSFHSINCKNVDTYQKKYKYTQWINVRSGIPRVLVVVVFFFFWLSSFSNTREEKKSARLNTPKCIVRGMVFFFFSVTYCN